jgi:hypothetical protein
MITRGSAAASPRNPYFAARRSRLNLIRCASSGLRGIAPIAPTRGSARRFARPGVRRRQRQRFARTATAVDRRDPASPASPHRGKRERIFRAKQIIWNDDRLTLETEGGRCGQFRRMVAWPLDGT